MHAATQDMRAALQWAPLGQCSLLVFPMLSFSVVLMVLIYVYDWQRHHVPIVGLSLNSGLYTDVFFVDLPATRLITVASWSSSAVLTLMGSFMNLLSYAVAADLIRSSRSSFNGVLPTPNQLTLLIELLDGKKLAIVQWFMATWQGRTGQRQSIWLVEVAVALQTFVVILW
jgi:hypothetical protein